MKLEDVSAEIRPRTSWEAIDLGMALVRRDYGFIMLAWACTVLPFCALLFFLLQAWPSLWAIAIFWFKPLYDRVPLFILSRSLFGPRPSLREILGSPKFFIGMLIGDLTWRRFSPARSYLMPVGLLEGLSGKPRSTRISILNREADAHTTSLITACALFEVAIAFGFIGLLAMLNPSTAMGAEMDNWVAGFEMEEFSPTPNIVYYLFTAAYFLAISLVEPFYIGGGFGMYVNGRTRSEGWDLELKFRQLESRLVARVTQTITIILLSTLLITSTTPGQAQDAILDLETELTQTEEIDSAPKTVADKILEQPEFEVHSRTQEKWDWKGNNPESNRGGGVGFFQILGDFFFWLVVVAAIGGLAYWIYTYRHVFLNRSFKRSSTPSHSRTTTTVMGMDVRAESLPDNIAQAAWDAWAAGQRQEALSLLYRGSISWMVVRENLPIIESDTEFDCIQRAEALTDRQMAAYFNQLTDRWTSAAYGKLWPDDAAVELLCKDWPFHHKETSS
ncbi:hypothetical protein N9260_00045 [bacterium]|nr:hypothetical protein [bacterium]